MYYLTCFTMSLLWILQLLAWCDGLRVPSSSQVKCTSIVLLNQTTSGENNSYTSETEYDLQITQTTPQSYVPLNQTDILHFKLWLNTLNENETGWTRLIGCFQMETLKGIDFTNNSFQVPTTTTYKQLDECIQACRKFKAEFSYFGLVQNKMCYCYQYENDVTIDSNCEPEPCVEGSTQFCGLINQTVVIYRLGGYINQQDTSSNETTEHSVNIVNSGYFNICTEDNDSFSNAVLWNIVISLHSNISGYSLKISNARLIDNSKDVNNKTVDCEIFNWQNSTNITIASACVAAINKDTSSTMITRCTQAYLVGFNESDDSMHHANSPVSSETPMLFVVVGATSLLLVLSVIVLYVCCYRKNKRKKKLEESAEGIPLSLINIDTGNDGVLYRENTHNLGVTNSFNDTGQNNDTEGYISNEGDNSRNFHRIGGSSGYELAYPLNNPESSKKVETSGVYKEHVDITPQKEVYSEGKKHNKTPKETTKNLVYSEIRLKKEIRKSSHLEQINIEKDESEYDVLDHTLLHIEDGSRGNVVYDSVKPSILPVDTFGCSEYDSLSTIRNSLSKT